MLDCRFHKGIETVEYSNLTSNSDRAHFKTSEVNLTKQQKERILDFFQALQTTLNLSHGSYHLSFKIKWTDTNQFCRPFDV